MTWDHLTGAIASAAGAGLGWIVTRYVLLPDKVAALADDVSYLRTRLDALYDHLIKP